MQLSDLDIEKISMTDIPEYFDSNITDDRIFTEDIIDEENIDNWNIDDFFIALPEKIKNNSGIILGLYLYYSVNTDDSYWVAEYSNPINDNSDIIREGDTPLEALKNLYIKLKENYVE